MVSKLTLSCKLATTEDFKLFGTPIKSEKLPITSTYDLISIFFENCLKYTIWLTVVWVKTYKCAVVKKKGFFAHRVYHRARMWRHVL